MVPNCLNAATAEAIAKERLDGKALFAAIPCEVSDASAWSPCKALMFAGKRSLDLWMILARSLIDFAADRPLCFGLRRLLGTVALSAMPTWP